MDERAARKSSDFADFSGKVDFRFADFSGAKVDFRTAKFSDGTVDFRGAECSDGTVDFSYARFSGGTVDFIPACDWSSPPKFSWTDTPPPGVKLR